MWHIDAVAQGVEPPVRYPAPLAKCRGVPERDNLPPPPPTRAGNQFVKPLEWPQVRRELCAPLRTTTPGPWCMFSNNPSLGHVLVGCIVAVFDCADTSTPPPSVPLPQTTKPSSVTSARASSPPTATCPSTRRSTERSCTPARSATRCSTARTSCRSTTGATAWVSRGLLPTMQCFLKGSLLHVSLKTIDLEAGGCTVGKTGGRLTCNRKVASSNPGSSELECRVVSEQDTKP